jgi:hypothetical protein
VHAAVSPAEGIWRYCAGARPSRRGDRVSLLSLLHVLRSGSGTTLTSRNVRH